MEYQRSGTRLRFDPERIDTRNIINRLPNLGRMNLGQMDAYYADIVQALVVQIQNNAERNALRIYAFNMWGDRGFENQDFAELVELYASYVLAILLSSQNADPVAVINGEAEPFVDAATSQLVELDQGLVQWLPAEAEGALQQMSVEWQRIIRTIRNAERQYGGGPQSTGGARVGRPRPSSPGGFNTGKWGVGAEAARETKNYDNILPTWEKERRAKAAQQGGIPAAAWTPNPHAAAQGARRAPAESNNTRSIPERSASNKRIGDAYEDDFVAAPAAARSPSAARPFDYIGIDQNWYLVPAYQSPVTPTYTPANPPLAYDRKTHMLFFLMNNRGVPVKDVLKVKAELTVAGHEGMDVDYLEHELDEKLKKAYRQNAKITQRTLDVMPMRTLIPSKDGILATNPTAEKRKELRASNTAPRLLFRPIVAASLDRAMHKAAAHRSMEMIADGEPIEYLVNEVSFRDIHNHALEPVTPLLACKNFSDLGTQIEKLTQAKIGEVPNKEHVALAATVNARLTKVLNRFLAKQMWLAVSVDSFMEDFPDLPEYIEKRYGEEVVKLLMAAAPEIIRRALHVLKGDNLDAFTEELNMEVSGTAKSKGVETDSALVYSNAAVFAEEYSITEVPWTLAEMIQHWRLEGLVSEQGAQPLHAMLVSIVDRVQGRCAVHLLATADRQVVYVYRSPLTPGEFMITAEGDFRSGDSDMPASLKKEYSKF